jgi:hypothetical protein
MTSQQRAQLKWNEKNQEKIKAYQKEYYQKHKLELKIKRLTK